MKVNKEVHYNNSLYFAVLLVLIGLFVLLQGAKHDKNQSKIIAKKVIIDEAMKKGTDSAILSAREKLKAIDSEQGLDSLINEIKK